MPIGIAEIVVLLVTVAVFAGLVALAYLIVRALVRAVAGPSKRLEAELGVEVLAGRLARGEITQAEFEEGRRLLGVR